MDRFAVAGDTYLKNRNGVFYLEMRVPSKLAGELRKTHIRWSLKTSSASEARRLRNTKLAEIEKLFLEAEQNLAIKKGNRTRIENISEGQMEVIISNWVGKEQKAAQASYEFYLSGEIPEDSDFPGAEQVVKEFSQHLSLLEAGSSPMRDQHILSMAIKCATDQQLSLNYVYSPQVLRSVAEIDADQGSKPYRIFLELVRKAMCEMMRFQIALYAGGRHKPEYESVMPSSGTTKRKSRITLDRLIELHEADLSKSAKNKKLQYKYDFIFRVMREVWGGEKDVKEIDRADCRDIRVLLMKLPANSTKKFPGQSFSQITEAISRMAPEVRPALLDVTTLNSHLANISTFFQFAVNETYIQVNPAKSLAIEKSTHNKDDRHPFSDSELALIFSSEHFSSSGNKQKPDGFPYQPSTETSRYWASIIALFHGMRSNEISQLRLADIGKVDGEYYFDLKADDSSQRLKTPSSKREVPFHPVLKKLDFAKYVRACREGGEAQLFPDFTLDSTGYYSRNISRWFNDQLLVRLAIKRKGLSFHSLRHNFKDAARRAGLREQHSMAICGHGEGTVASKYGEGFRAFDLAPEIAKIKFVSVNLQPL